MTEQPEHQSSEPLFGYTPIDAAHRAVVAAHGVCVLVGSSSERQYQSLTASTWESLRQLDAEPPSDPTEVVRGMRSLMEQKLEAAKVPLFKSNPSRIWQLFMERYDFATNQLRANLLDVAACLDLSELSRQFKQPSSYFHRLPMSSEVALSRWPGGVRLDLVIPPRLLFLDMALMLRHAELEHSALERAFEEKDRILMNNGRLDSYSRQTIILGASLCDMILTEYGMALTAAIETSEVPEEIDRKVSELQGNGLTRRLTDAPSLWSEALSRPFSEPPDSVKDMLILVQIRNRLIHPDGRVNCWFAFQLDAMRGGGWTFSQRFKEYEERPVSYRIPNSNVGYEFCIAAFCVDTVLQTIDYFHNLCYPDDSRPPWMNLPRTHNGGLDLTEAIKTETLLQIQAD